MRDCSFWFGNRCRCRATADLFPTSVAGKQIHRPAHHKEKNEYCCHDDAVVCKHFGYSDAQERQDSADDGDDLSSRHSGGLSIDLGQAIDQVNHVVGVARVEAFSLRPGLSSGCAGRPGAAAVEEAGRKAEHEDAVAIVRVRSSMYGRTRPASASEQLRALPS